MKEIVKSNRFKIFIVLVLVPLTAWAVTWSMNGYSTPQVFRKAASELGLRVTQACRPGGAKYGAKRSKHKTCQAMDLSRSTPRSKIQALKRYGLCGQWHRKGYYRATADHWHVVQCSTGSTKVAARRQQEEKVKKIREGNVGFWRNLFRPNGSGSKRPAPKPYQSESLR
ncbi:hypothetical protein GW916_06880 [bacterium]|nr:hypothetical protein [bacterium]